MRTGLSTIVLTGTLGLLVGCSGGGTSPLAPGTTPAPAATDTPTAPSPPARTPLAPVVFPQLTSPLPVGLDPSTNGESGSGVMGLYGLNIDAVSLDATLEPLTRGVQLGEDFEVDVTDFFRKSPCTDCLQVTGLSLDPSGNVLVDIEARHPFAVPPPGSGRLDLHVFDMELQVAVPGLSGNPDFYTNSQIDTRLSGVTSNVKIMKPGFLTNADGYASHLTRIIDDITGSEATLYPFVLMKIEEPVSGQYNPATVSGFADLTNPVGYNVFGMGQAGTAQLNLDFNGAEQVGVVLALDAKYGVSARGNIPVGQPGNRRSPRYFLPEYNRKEAWRVLTNVTANTLIDTSASSFATIDIEINDWQHSLGTVNPGYVFTTASLDSLRQSSDVASVSISAPDLMAAPVTSSTPVSGDGSIANPLLYTMTVNNTLLAAAGEYFATIAVRDELRAAPPSNAGVERDGVTFFEIDDFSTYQVVSLTVIPGNEPPNCSFIGTPSGGTVPHRTNVLLDASATTDDNDPPGSLIYEWDYDYDGVTFTVDATGAIVSTTMNNTTAVADPRQVALRVTDLDGATCGPITLDFTVNPNNLPTCVLSVIPSGTNVPSGGNKGLTGATSSDVEDPFAALVFAWDTNYNGTLFNPNPLYAGQNSIAYDFVNPLPTPVNQTIAMRVTDVDGGFCISSVTFTVGPNQAPRAIITRPGSPVPTGTGYWNNGVSSLTAYPNLTNAVPLYINRTASLDFDGTSSYDTDGTVVGWNWDYENVNVSSADLGVGFTSDDAIQNPAPRSYTTYGSTYVCLRATDNVGAFGYVRREIMVTPWDAQSYAEVDGLRANWDISRDKMGTGLSRVGTNVFAIGYASNPAGTNFFLNTVRSTNSGGSWVDRAAVDNLAQNNTRSAAIDAADGNRPFAAFMGLNGDLAFRRATASSGTAMWSPATAAERKVITTGAAAGYANAQQIDLTVQPGNVNNALVGVIANNSGGLEFWKTNDALNGGTSTWTRLTGVFFPLAGGATSRTNLDVAFDVTGDVHVSWQDITAGADRIGYAQFSPVGTGSAYGNQQLPASTGINGGLEPALWVDTSGRPLIAFADDRNGSFDIFLVRGDSGNVPVFSAAQQVSTDGTRIGRAAVDRDQVHPGVCVDGAGNIWLVWEDTREDTFGLPTANPEIYGVVLNNALTVVAANHSVNHFDPYNLISDKTPWIVADRTTPGSGTNAVTAFWCGDTSGGTSEIVGSRATLQ